MTYEELVAAINEADRLYYDDPDNAAIPDAEYDRMYQDLIELEQRLPAEAVRSDSPTQRVQGTSTFAPTRHAEPMLSLGKVTTMSELDSFLSRCAPWSVSIEPKLDGASLSLEYEDSRLVRAVTRGDGTTGDDVTANAVHIFGIPFDLPQEGFTGWVRGEVVINRDDFLQVNVDGRFANARNAAAGALRRSDPYEPRRRRLRFYPYDSSDGITHYGDGFLTYDSSIEMAQNAVPSIRAHIEAHEAGGYPFETDGVVVKLVDKSRRVEMGATGKHPRWAVAFKTQGEIGTTTLNGVTWQVGANGAVTPVAELAPVAVGGTTISRATLHNPKYLTDKDICIGDRVEITRAGDVIPCVLRSLGAESRVRIKVPHECPACESVLKQDGNSGQVYCRDSQRCPAQAQGRLVKWAGRDAADIDAIGPTWIRKLVDDRKLVDPADFYRLQERDIDQYEGMGQRRAQQFIESIAASKNVGMRRALIGFSIPHASEGTAKRLAKVFASVEEVEAATVQQLAAIDDIGIKVAESIVSFFATNRYLTIDLRDQGVNLDRLDEDAPVDTSAGHAFCVTGSVPGYKSRKDFIAALEQKGWTSQSGVGKTTEYLILDDPDSTSSKAKKARSLGVPIITPEQAAEKAGITP